METISIDKPRTDLNGAEFFTDGHRAVLWVSGERISMLEVERIGPPLP